MRRDGEGMMTRSEALALIRPIARPFFVETCDFLGCVDNDEDGPYDDAVIRLLADGYGGRGIYVSCGEYPEEGSQHFGLDPATRGMRGNARRRELMARVEARTMVYWADEGVWVPIAAWNKL